MDEVDEHLRNLKGTGEKIRNLETENYKAPVEKPMISQSESFKDIIQKLRSLQAERKSLLSEIEELKKIAEAKAIALENEVAALRDEVQSLKILMSGSDPYVDKRQSATTKRNNG